MTISSVFTMKSVHRFSQSRCRICGKSNGVYVNILEKKSKRYLLQVRKFLQVEISSSDNFTKAICHTCIATLNDFAVLFEQCQAVQRELNESMCNEEILRRQDSIFYEGDDSSHQNLTIDENEENLKPIVPNLIILNDQSHLLEAAEPTDEERISDPLSSETDFAVEQELSNGILNYAPNDLHEGEIISEEVREETSPSINSDSDNWRIQQLPNSDTKLYMCNRCSAILLCEGAKKSHQCHLMDQDLVISGDSPKKLKLESDF